jgi:hypothetical protein
MNPYQAPPDPSPEVIAETAEQAAAICSVFRILQTDAAFTWYFHQRLVSLIEHSKELWPDVDYSDTDYLTVEFEQLDRIYIRPLENNGPILELTGLNVIANGTELLEGFGSMLSVYATADDAETGPVKKAMIPALLFLSELIYVGVTVAWAVRDEGEPILYVHSPFQNAWLVVALNIYGVKHPHPSEDDQDDSPSNTVH